jgi:hypothetical protein
MQYYYWTWVTHKGENMLGEWRKERKLKLECSLCAHYRGANIVILYWQRPLWKKE